MSSTNVKFKASTARSEARPSVAKSAGGVKSASKMKSASSAAKDTAKSASMAAENVPAAADDAAKDAASAPSTFESIANEAKPYLSKHRREVTYGIIGIIAAVLILIIGFWPVLLLAIFAGIGIAIAKAHDSGFSMQTAAKSLANNFRR